MSCKTCLVLLSLMALSAMTGCGGDGNGVEVSERLSITHISPRDGGRGG